MTEPTAKGKGGRTVGTRTLKPKEKAEAVALWRGGGVTLDDLATKFKRRPETFSRMFKKMGITKGSGVVEAAKAMEEAAVKAVVSETEETLRRIRATKDEHFRMSNGLAKLAWAEIVRARQAGIPLDKLKDIMATLKIASDVIGNSRKELFEILNVEKHDKIIDEDELPELTVRELTSNEVQQLQQAPDLDDDVADLDDPMGLDIPNEEG